jgi:hypothetical protein
MSFKNLFSNHNFLLFYFVYIILLIIGCNVNKQTDNKINLPQRDINIVKEAHTEELMKIPGVVGVYVGQFDDGTPCIGVMVIKKTPELERKIPRIIEGYRVKIDETGEIKPLN